MPFSLLNANERHSAWLTPVEMIDLYLADPQPPPMIDLSGGQPDLTPEWVPWMMAELKRRDLADKVYLWSDDNLRQRLLLALSADDHDSIKAYRNYGRVASFKGIDRESFAFNTGADPLLFDKQFELFRRFLALGLDLYAYVTFTTPNGETAQSSLRDFTDRLQQMPAFSFRCRWPTLCLRLAEQPALYEYREAAMREFFPDSMVKNYEHLVAEMKNHPKDRHVLAAAVACSADCGVTFNLEDFVSPSADSPKTKVIGPSTFLKQLTVLDSAVVEQRLGEQAAAIGIAVNDLLDRLAGSVPGFVSLLREP